MGQQFQVFWASKTYDKQLTIKKTVLPYQVWSHGGSTFEKEGHKTAIFPALHKLTHICRHAYEYTHIYNIKVVSHHHFDIGGIPNGNVAEKYTSSTIMAQVCTGWPSLRGILLWQAGTARHLSQVHSISFKISGSNSGFTQSNVGSEQICC